MKDILNRLAALDKRGMIFGTETERKMLNALGSPDKKLKIVHVAGTNGKGSTCAYLANILRLNGKRTGVYTSPAVFDFSEQYSCDNLSGQILKDSFNAVLSLGECKNATRFEAETASAIYAFALAGAEYAVLECGMGGKYDATNAVGKKELAVITSVSLEHTAYLGKTLKEICAQKAGIIKNCPAVVSPYQAPEALSFFKGLGAKFPDPPEITEGSGFFYGGEYFECGIGGAVQPYNAALAIECAKTLGFNDTKILQNAIKSTRLAGRFELLRARNRTFILDGAHNPSSIEELCKSLNGVKNPAIIYGCLSDKDIGNCVKPLAKISDKAVAVQPESPRAMNIEIIYKTLKTYFKQAERAASVSAALESLADENIVVCGSFTLLKEAKSWIEKRL